MAHSLRIGRGASKIGGGEVLNNYSLRNVQKTVEIRLSGLSNSNNREILQTEYRNTTSVLSACRNNGQQ